MNNNHLSLINCKGEITHLPICPFTLLLIYPSTHLRACKAHLYNCRGLSTNQLFIMQNEPNFRKSQMNVNKVLIKDYEKNSNWTLGENEPKTNPNEANFQKAQMFVTTFQAEGYENKSNWAICENKPNTKPIQTQTKPISEAKNAALWSVAQDKCARNDKNGSPLVTCGDADKKSMFRRYYLIFSSGSSAFMPK